MKHSIINSTLASNLLALILLVTIQPVLAQEPSLEEAKKILEAEVMIDSNDVPYVDMAVITTNKGLSLQTMALNPHLKEDTHRKQVASKCLLISGPGATIWDTMPAGKEIRIDIVSEDAHVLLSETCPRKDFAPISPGGGSGNCDANLPTADQPSAN